MVTADFIISKARYDLVDSAESGPEDPFHGEFGARVEVSIASCYRLKVFLEGRELHEHWSVHFQVTVVIEPTAN